MEAPCAGIYSFALVSGPLADELPLNSEMSWAVLGAACTTKLQNLNREQTQQQDAALQFRLPALSDLPGMCFPMYLMCISCSPTSVGAYLTVTVPSLLSTISGVSVFPEGMCTSPTKGHRGSYRKKLPAPLLPPTENCLAISNPLFKLLNSLPTGTNRRLMGTLTRRVFHLSYMNTTQQ